MYKTVVTKNKYYDKTIQLHKNHKNVLHLPMTLKVSGSISLSIIATSVMLAVFVSGNFLALLFALVLVGIITAGACDIEGFEFFPYKKDKSEEHVGASKGYEYNVLTSLHEVMEYPEVDNFTNRQDIAAEIFNLIKVRRLDRSMVSDADMRLAQNKLDVIHAAAVRQRKEIKTAGLHTETPALNIAADILSKD